MAYESVSATVLGGIDWVIGLLVIWIIYEIFKMFGSFTGASSGGKISGILDGVFSSKKKEAGEPGEIPAAKEKLKKRQGKVGKEEAAEEAFTLDAVKKVKEAYENIVKIRGELEQLGKERSLNDKKIDLIKYDVESLIGGVLNDAQKWEKGIVKVARKLKREFNRDDARGLKAKEEKALEVAQAIMSELRDAKEGDQKSVKVVIQLLDHLKKMKNPDGSYDYAGIGGPCLNSLAFLAGKLKTTYSHLSILFKLEEEIKKETVKEEAEAA